MRFVVGLSLIALSFACGPAAPGNNAQEDAGTQPADAQSNADASLRPDSQALQDVRSEFADVTANPVDASSLDAGPSPDASRNSDVTSPDVNENADASVSTPDAEALDAGPSLQCLGTLIPGPGCPNHDAELAAKALRHDRAFHAIIAAPYALSTELAVVGEDKRENLRAFVQDHDTWDYESAMGHAVTDDTTTYSKTAGLFSGVGIATDAYRYAVLRDEGAEQEEIDRARVHLIDGLEALHWAKTITGTPGVIARGFIRTDINAISVVTVPLFDGSANALPRDKNNGTWREDNSGLYPNHVWEDSCSRDQYIGWVAAYGAAWEVVQNDPTIDALYKTRLQEEAQDLGAALMERHNIFYDLEIPDADGRTTFHGYLHEEAYERQYVPFLPVKNAVNAVMALGIVSTLAWVSGDADLNRFLNVTLIASRDLPSIIEDDMQIDFGNDTNFSNYNMAFMGAFLATRTLEDAAARAKIRNAFTSKLYQNSGAVLQPDGQGWKHTLYDFVFVSAMADHSLHRSGTMPVNTAALERGMETLRAFDEAPLFDDAVINCDAAELSDEECLAVDGQTVIRLRGSNDRFGKPMAQDPVPLAVRPRSSYEWRSHPFRVNHEGTPLLFSGVDFRYAYWMGRYLKR